METSLPKQDQQQQMLWNVLGLQFFESCMNLRSLGSVDGDFRAGVVAGFGDVVRKLLVRVWIVFFLCWRCRSKSKCSFLKAATGNIDGIEPCTLVSKWMKRN